MAAVQLRGLPGRTRIEMGENPLEMSAPASYGGEAYQEIARMVSATRVSATRGQEPAMSQSATLERTTITPHAPGPAAGAPARNTASPSARSTEGRTPARGTAGRTSRQYTTWVTGGLGAVIVLLSVVLMAYAAPSRPSAPTGRAPAPHGPVQLQRDLGPARGAGLVPAFAPAGHAGGAGRTPEPAK
jgi:hypothetical protein